MFVLGMFLFTGCFSVSEEALTIIKDDEIPKQDKVEIAQMDEQLFTAFKTGDASLIKDIITEKHMRDYDDSKIIIEDYFKNLEGIPTYTNSLNYIIKSDKSVNKKAELEKLGNDDYYVRLPYVKEETYVSINNIKVEKSVRTMTVLYVKENNSWKVDYLEISGYTLNGHPARYYYELAKKEDNTSFESFTYIDMAGNLSNSELLISRYKKNILEAEEKIFDNLDVKFPKKISYKGKEYILNDYSQKYDDNHGIIIMLSYDTNYSLNEKEKIQEEAKELTNAFLNEYSEILKVSTYYLVIIENKPLRESNGYESADSDEDANLYKTLVNVKGKSVDTYEVSRYEE